MSVTQTVRREPPLRNSNISDQMQYWELETQQASPLITVDSSKGADSIPLPAAGLIGTTGQTNQNSELTYKKVSSDANAATITGAADGPQTLTAQYSFVKFKSDGTAWYVVGHS